MKASEAKPGNAITLDGKVYVVVSSQFTKPGKGPAYVQIKMREVGGAGANIERRFNSTDTLAGTTLDRRNMEYLYSDGSGHIFMDTQSYDQTTLTNEFAGETMLYLRPNTGCTVLFHDGNPVIIELPGSVELTITDTPPGIKGATVTNQLKEATCETGLKTRVPPFIEIGETIRVSTVDGSYQSRA